MSRSYPDTIAEEDGATGVPDAGKSRHKGQEERDNMRTRSSVG